VGGKIVSVMVKEGQQAKAGDVLFLVDQQPFQIQFAQADAASASARCGSVASPTRQCFKPRSTNLPKRTRA
jgi:membrane fusion protein, multidrug efflux system